MENRYSIHSWLKKSDLQILMLFLCCCEMRRQFFNQMEERFFFDSEIYSEIHSKQQGKKLKGENFEIG